MRTVVGFPNIGLDEIILNPVAINLFGLEVRWYGLIIVTGIILAFAYACYRGRKNEGLSSDDMLDYFIYTVLFAVIGARAYYVLTSLDQYSSFWEMFQIWNGGLAIYGAIIAGGITIYVVSKAKKKSVMRALDMVSPAVMIGQILGRWGNFFNGEAFGHISKFEFFGLTFNTPNVESLPWIMRVNSYATGYTDVIAHPTFLYESLWNLVGFLLINALYTRKKFHGQVFFMYISWYGLGRAFIEGFRSDSLYIGGIKISQLIGLACFFVGVLVLAVRLVRTKEKFCTLEACEIKNETNEKENTENGKNN